MNKTDFSPCEYFSSSYKKSSKKNGLCRENIQIRVQDAEFAELAQNEYQKFPNSKPVFLRLVPVISIAFCERCVFLPESTP